TRARRDRRHAEEPAAGLRAPQPDRLRARDRKVRRAAPALVEQEGPRRQLTGSVRRTRAQVASPESRCAAPHVRRLLAALRGYAPVLHAHSGPEEVRSRPHARSVVAAQHAVAPGPSLAALAPRGARREREAVALVSPERRPWLRPRSSARLELHRARRSTRSADTVEGVPQLCGVRRTVAARHLLAAQSGVSQRCVRRLAGLLVSVFGRPAGDRGGARDARLPARPRN